MKEIGHKGVYFVSSQWIRLSNTVIWSVGAIFIPLSFSAYAYALMSKDIYYPLAFGLLLILGVWIYIVYLYGYTAEKCRIAMAQIENENKLDSSYSIYTERNKIFHGPFGFRNGFVIITVFFVLSWFFGFFFAKDNTSNLEISAIKLPAGTSVVCNDLRKEAETERTVSDASVKTFRQLPCL